MRMKKRIYSGVVCEQVVYCVSDKAKNPKKAKPKVTAKTEEEKAAHRDGIARRRFVRMVNANFTPAGYWVCLTMSQENECHTFEEAKLLRRNLVRRLTYRFPKAKIVIVMGRGHSTSRIHLHMLIEGQGVTTEAIIAAWKYGEVTDVEHLREHCKNNGKDLGPEYTALATYMIKHWTPEQGGHRYYASKNMVKPEEEKPKECVREYGPEKPPIAPKGYFYVGCQWNQFGYAIYKYVREPEKKARKKRGERPAVE